MVRPAGGIQLRRTKGTHTMLEKMSLHIRCPDSRPGRVIALALMILTCLSLLIPAGFSGGRAYAASANSQYSLAGAQYQLYTDSACTTPARDSNGANAVLTTNESGGSNTLTMTPGIYYAKEIKPGKGYRLDPGVYTVTVAGSGTATFTSKEPPAYGIPDFMVYKRDTDGAAPYTRLLGARFTVKYYDVSTKEEIAGAAPKDQWTFEAVKKEAPSGQPEGTYWAGIDWQNDDPVEYRHEGEGKFYEITEGDSSKRVLPLGWFTIEETEAPDGFKGTDRIVCGHISQPEVGAEAVTGIEGAERDTGLNKDTLVFENEPFEPKVTTTASVQLNNSEVLDIVRYDDVMPESEYLIKGWLVDTKTGDKVPESDGSASFTTEDKTSGQIEVTLKTAGFDGMAGHRMTAFEELYLVIERDGKREEKLVASHKDTEDSDQTVEIRHDLKIRKNVTGNLGDLSKVFEYTAEFTGLVPDESYKVEGYDEKVFNADPSGNAIIPLKLMDDREVIIRQLPKGATYRITEAASDHISGFKVRSEDMADNGAKIVQASGSNGAEAAKALSTALETVDLFDGTVVVVWENNRDLATLTAVQSYLGIWAFAGALVLGGLLMMIVKTIKHTDI